MIANKKGIAVVGAGFSGAVIARELALAGYTVHVFESRPHTAGNCFTDRDERSGVMVHRYGPHIFHTNDSEVWQYVNQFGEFRSYTNRVKAVSGGAVYGLPINLHTINQFFGKTFDPREARDFINQITHDSSCEAKTFEEQALQFVGREIYEAFFLGYTTKQWGVHPDTLPASILKRLPLRFDYNDNYFDHPYQAIPADGYTTVIDNILDHPAIHLEVNRRFDRSETSQYQHTFYSGCLDEYFGFSLGVLGYRTLDFEPGWSDGDFQGNAVINYCDLDIPWTRITEHKHFAPWEKHEGSIYFKETSREYEPGDIPFYPIRLAEEKSLLNKYIDLAHAEENVSFVGRLGTYRYIDMDVTIREALDASRYFVSGDTKGEKIPSFFVSPI